MREITDNACTTALLSTERLKMTSLSFLSDILKQNIINCIFFKTSTLTMVFVLTLYNNKNNFFIFRGNPDII